MATAAWQIAWSNSPLGSRAFLVWKVRVVQVVLESRALIGKARRPSPTGKGIWSIASHRRLERLSGMRSINCALPKLNVHMANPETPFMNSVIELPFNRLLGLEVANDPAKVLELPAGGQYLNHLGTVHAGAQLALAEASSGEFLLRTMGDMQGIVPVVRRLESKFRKPAHGVLTSTATAPEGIEGLRSELEAKGRALVTIQVELYDEIKAHTLSASVEWFVTRAQV